MALLRKYGLQDYFQLFFVGQSSVSRDVAVSSQEDVEKIDSRIVPLAFIILAIAIKSLALMVVPIIAIPLSLLAQFLCFYPMHKWMEVISHAASIMTSLTLALGIDYSLFMLTRFMDGVNSGRSIEESIELMLRSAGRVIIISCITLFCTIGGQLAFPLGMMRSMVVGSLVSMIISLLVNLTLVPALLYIMGPGLIRLHNQCSFSKLVTKVKRLYSKEAKELKQEPPTAELVKGTSGSAVDEEVKDEGHASVLSLPSTSDSPTYGDEEPRIKAQGTWFAIARIVSVPRKAVMVVLAVCALIAPVAYYAKDLKYAMTTDYLTPASAPTSQGFKVIFQDFGGHGPVYPYHFVLRAKSNAYPNGLNNEEGFTGVQSAIRGLMGAGLMSPKDFQSIYVTEGQFISWETYQAATDMSSPTFNDPLSKYLRLMNYLFTAETQRDVLVVFFASFDPYSETGRQWLFRVRELMATEGSRLGLDIYLEGSAAAGIDSVDGVFRAFRVAAPLMLGVAFLMVAIFFRSIMAPIRSVLTTVLTISFVYGFVVLVYQKGIFDFLKFDPLGSTGAVMWFMVLMAFSLITGKCRTG